MILVERLDFLAGVRILLMSLKTRPRTVVSLSASPGGLWIVAVLKRLGLCEGVRTMTLDFASLMPGGGGLWHWTQVATEDLAERAACRMEASGNPLRRVSARLTRARCEAYFRRLISQEIYYLVGMCLVAEREAPGVERIALARVSDLAPILEDLPATWIGATRFRSVPSLNSSVVVRWLHLLWNHLWLLGLWSDRGRPAPASSVAIQSFWGAETGETGARGDLWWYRASQLGPERAVVFSNSPKRPAADAALDRLEGHGYRCRVLTRDANHSCRRTVTYRLSHPGTVLRDMRDAFELWAWSWRAPAGRWRFAVWLRAVAGIRRWQAFMETEGIRALFDVAETSSETASLACDVVGGVKLGMHWGDYPAPFARITPMQQVQFIWGPRYADVLEAMGSPADVIVEAGSIFDHADYREEWTSMARVHRAALKARDVKRILCVIDRSCSDLSVYPTPYHVVFYDNILDWAERDPSLGLIIKPKAPEGPAVAGLLPDIEARIHNLTDEGRALVLTGPRYVGEGAAASDLVFALGLNSGGLLCALEGVPTVFWDPARSREAPTGDWIERFGWSDPDVVFDNLDEMITRARRFLEDREADPSFGDGRSAIMDVDGFRDGRTGERIACFVDSFIRAVDGGNSRSQALEAAALEYNDRWGAGRAAVRLTPADKERQASSLQATGG